MQRRRAGAPHGSQAIALAAIALLTPEMAAAAGGLNIMPDLYGLLPVMIVLFVLLILPVSRFVVQPMLRVLDERRERIEGRRERSRKIQSEAHLVQDRYEEAVGGARETAQNARREVLEDARKTQTGITGSARSAAEAKVTEARNEVARKLDAAREQLRSEAEDLAREAASSVLGRRLS